MFISRRELESIHRRIKDLETHGFTVRSDCYPHALVVPFDKVLRKIVDYLQLNWEIKLGTATDIELKQR